jgi:redox-sensitive bicupin YhaK (pirin superfamily)
MWIFANKRDLSPSWEQKKFSREERKNRLLPIVIPENQSDGPALHIHQDAAVYVSSMDLGSKIDHDILPGRKAYLFVIDGGIKLNGDSLKTRDVARIENEGNLSILADQPTELILLDLPEKYAINN